MVMFRHIALAALAVFALSAQATYVSSPPLTDFSISLDNGMVYVYLPQVASPCMYGRLEIRDSAPYSTEYAKRLVAAVYMAKAASKSVTFIWNDASAPTCLLSAIAIEN